MRHVRPEFGLLALLLLAGCNTFPLSRGSAPQQQAARVPQEVPKKEDILAYLNSNASRVQSLRCKELDISCKQGLQAFGGLRGQVVCEKPRNFRMSANIMGKQEVDVGSNQNEFWFWIARAEPQYLYHCNYDDLAGGNVRMPFPFQPEWIMEALGIAECKAPENYELVVKQNVLELVENTRSPQGVQVRKVTIINLAPARAPNPQVTAHILQDAQGKEICSAHITRVQVDRTTGAIVPHEVRLVCPAEKMELKMVLDDVTVNDRTLATVRERLFGRPHLSNVPSFDLARGLDPGPGGVRRIGAQRTQ